MRLRLTLLITPVLAVSLLVAGCGASSGSEGGATPAGGGDAATVLASLQPVAQEGPQRIGVTLTAQLKGEPKDPAAAAFLGSGPISFDLSGPIDPATKAADLTFSVKAGKIDMAGGLRMADDRGYVQLNGTWYELPAGSLTTGSTQTAATPDTAAVLAALGDPADLLKNATLVGAEDVDGIPADHVSGDVDTAALMQAIGRIAGAVGTTASPVSPEQIAEATAKLGQLVKSAKVDLWIGTEDRQLHRIAVDVDVALDAETAASSGIEGLTARLTVTSTPTSAPTVTAPAGALPADRLGAGLAGLVGGGLGAGIP